MCLFHKWTKWKDIKEGDLLHSEYSYILGRVIVQEKRCIKCNKVERRVSNIYYG